MGLPTNDYLKIISQSYGPRKPLVVCEASSLDMLADLDCAEGSTATVGGTEYVLDRVNGWVEPGSGGGGGSTDGLMVVKVTMDSSGIGTMNKTWKEISAVLADSMVLIALQDTSLPGTESMVFGGYVTFLTRNPLGEVGVVTVLQRWMVSAEEMQYASVTFTATSPDGYPTANLS